VFVNYVFSMGFVCMNNHGESLHMDFQPKNAFDAIVYFDTTSNVVTLCFEIDIPVYSIYILYILSCFLFSIFFQLFRIRPKTNISKCPDTCPDTTV